MRPNAGVARRAAIPRDPGDPGVRSRIDPEGAEVDIRRVYAASPTIEPTYDIEWIRSDLADIEISKFVNGIAGSKSTASRNNPRRCYRTSMSSGYSSHSPPLSAGSYSYYASASTRDPSYGSLAVIHESEAIPRPIWPSVIYHHTEDHSAGGYEGIYTCHVCGCTYKYSPPQPQLTSSPSRAREVLLELSRTLNSVIDGNVTAAPEDILRDISRIVTLEIGTRNDNVYEYICPSWAFSDKNPVSPSCVKNVPSKVNPINSKLCVSPRCLYEYNSTRFAPSLKNDRATRREGDSDMRNNSSFARKKPCATESKYSLVCSDVGSSITEGTIASLSANNWNHRLAGGLSEDFDFTLDVTQAERLGRTIARAKRKRQWCRALTTLFGLVFFVLSVVVVSLSVTRGRKVFGSM
ncbi:PREDICTED: uncharacterized protein LOC108755774 isoform X2 [Trachymyrmex septentrionalis]|uniref:uncharacterized protein LOC108755774 isoform X2 n=1 Tax=Trachymyrmex septentrionalis TaxID=34720 RepID=UPI00084F17A6|nr:PREDICTED: uncharacterized protein LOC108755774 isoform X2 [Trachymyrmex septentrionalis]